MHKSRLIQTNKICMGKKCDLSDFDHGMSCVCARGSLSSRSHHFKCRPALPLACIVSNKKYLINSFELWFLADHGGRTCLTAAATTSSGQRIVPTGRLAQGRWPDVVTPCTSLPSDAPYPSCNLPQKQEKMDFHLVPFWLKFRLATT